MISKLMKTEDVLSMETKSYDNEFTISKRQLYQFSIYITFVCR